MAVIEIDVISDFVCAWCYIGKKRLEQAIALYQKVFPGGKSDVFAITYRPYYLNYNPSSTSIDKSELAETKLAHMSAEQRAALEKRMDQIGRSVGISFRTGGKIGNTRDAHRLVHLARSLPAEVQDALVTGIYAAYHEREMDISLRSVLCQIAVEAGVDEAAAQRWMGSEEGSEVVEAEERRWKAAAEGAGVPTFLIAGERLVEAGDAQDLMEAFIRVKEASGEAEVDAHEG